MKKLLLTWIIFITSVFSWSLELGDSDFVYEEIDYTKTPVYKQIKKHPDQYGYLEKVTLYRILYRSEGLAITGFMVAPKTDGKFPVVLYNRGGNREFGALLVATATNVLAPIAAEGYLVVATNYRGNSGSEGAEEFGGKDVMDVVNLAKTCTAFPKADTSKLALFGVSRGGMMNYLILRNMTDYHLNIRCVISLGGISDLEKTIEYHPEIGTVCEEIIPGYTSNKTAELHKRSTIYWVNELPDHCPILLLHGTEDASVTYLQIPSFADSLDKYKKTYSLFSYEGDNHGIVHHRDHVRNQMNIWLNNFLVNQNPIEPAGQRTLVGKD